MLTRRTTVDDDPTGPWAPRDVAAIAERMSNSMGGGRPGWVARSETGLGVGDGLGSRRWEAASCCRLREPSLREPADAGDQDRLACSAMTAAAAVSPQRTRSWASRAVLASA